MKQVLVFVKAKNSLLFRQYSTCVPKGELLPDETPAKAAMRILKEIYGLRFKELQFIELDNNEKHVNVGLSLDYYPESYMDEDPTFVDTKEASLNGEYPLTEKFLTK